MYMLLSISVHPCMWYYLSVYIHVCDTIYQCTYMYVMPSISIHPCMWYYLSVYIHVCDTIYQYTPMYVILYLSVYIYVCDIIYQCTCMYVILSISIHPCMWYYLSVHMHVCDTIRLPYAFKMRQDYLSTSYLDQKYLLSERSETREMWIDPSNVCWDNPVSSLRHIVIFFSYLSLWKLIRMQ